MSHIDASYVLMIAVLCKLMAKVSCCGSVCRFWHTFMFSLILCKWCDQLKSRFAFSPEHFQNGADHRHILFMIEEAKNYLFCFFGLFLLSTAHVISWWGLPGKRKMKMIQHFLLGLLNYQKCVWITQGLIPYHNIWIRKAWHSGALMLKQLYDILLFLREQLLRPWQRLVHLLWFKEGRF